MRIPKEVFNLIHSASKDATRYHLGGIHLDFRNAVAVATDGHIMSKVKFPVNGADASYLPVTICADTAHYVLKLKDSIEDTEFDIDGGNFVVKAPGQTATFKLIDGEYPDYDSIHPKESRAEYIIGFNPALLAAISKSLSVTKGKGIKLCISKSNPIAPIRVLIPSDENLSALLMPMRI